MNEIIIDEKIEDMIYEIRGKQVMLDSDLARLYECKNGTKVINQAVNRNQERFPSDFYFQLSNIEYNSLRSQFVTTKVNNMSRSLPYAFTEQGIAMLATVIRTPIAAQMSINIMRTFVAMRHVLGNNEYRLSNLESKIIEHDNNIRLLQESFNKLDEKKKINEIYFNGQIYDAYYKIQEIFNEAKNSLIIIDGYADNTILNIIKRLKVSVIIITKPNNLLIRQDIKKYNLQYNNLKVVYDNTFHDRYFIIDKNILYHCGASINIIGQKTFSINLINDIEVCNALLNKVNIII